MAAHTRRVEPRDAVGDAESLPFFDKAHGPVETIELPAAETHRLAPGQFEVIGEKISYRLAQRPGSYVVLKYVRRVIKLRETQAIHCAPAPAGVIDGSRADVSFIAGVVVDKFAYHLPLYRQHQRLTDSGIRLTRPWLTQITQQAMGLLEPIYEAQLTSIRDSRVIAMDETPVKAGRTGHGKMKTGYSWPVYGGQDEVCFPCAQPITVLTTALEARILESTRHAPSNSTHWTTRKLAAHLRVSHMMVARVWRKHGLKPHRIERYMASNDPNFEKCDRRPARDSTALVGAAIGFVGALIVPL